MATIVTSSYRTDLTRLFVSDVSTSDYYLFVSSTANTSVSNSQESKREFLEKTLFGKKIDPDDVFYMTKNYPWEINKVYTQYDNAVDLSDKQYYAVVYPENNQTGDYRIYKCLFNNYGAQSINPPNYSASTPNQIYEMADGYIWKYMYELSVSEFDKYNTIGYIPIIEDASANTASANTGTSSATSTIDQVFVLNADTNKGYESVSGAIYQVTRGNENTVSIAGPAGAFSEIENYYSGYTLYVTNTTTSVSKLYTVNTYEWDNTNQRGVVTLNEGTPIDGVLTNSANYQLTPKVLITGNGTGASAIPIIDSNGTITKIRVINRGSGYTDASASVVDPYAFNPDSIASQDTRVVLKPILSPKGGHNANLVDELNSKHALTFIGLDNFDNDIIPTSNQFASVGIVKNPEFKVFPNPSVFDNRIELIFDSHSLSVNDVITQIESANTSSDFYNKTRFSGKVHAISGDVVNICEYMGPYPNDAPDVANTDFSDVSLKISLPLLSPDSETLTINTDNSPAYPSGYDSSTYPGFALSSYVQRTGEVLYMNNFTSVSRTANSKEQFKILLEF